MQQEAKYFQLLIALSYQYKTISVKVINVKSRTYYFSQYVMSTQKLDPIKFKIAVIPAK